MTVSLAEQIHRFLADQTCGKVIETHAARIYLGKAEAWKVKRAVRYDYLDFRALEDRHAVLLRELELNRPAAPTLYRDVVPITREADGSLSLDGAGTPVEWVLRMTRFPAEDELSAIATAGNLDRTLAEALGQVVYRLHENCPKRSDDGRDLIQEILDEFRREFESLHRKGADVAVIAVLADLQAQLDRVAALLSKRTGQGFVRRCHGDLHLRNIVVLDGVPTPFDALEFDERLGTCDVLYDIAFLLMDLVQTDLRAAANAVLNAYFDLEGRLEALQGLEALPLFAGVRAMVRAMVATEKQMGLAGRKCDFSEARNYVALAQRMLEPAAPRLIAIGGLSGTGKTTVARAIAPQLGGAFGALHLRSDIERKRLAGVDPLAHLPDSAYAPGASAAVYDAMLQRARACLAAGQSVIADAVFARKEERQAIEDMAGTLGVRFTGVWLDAADMARAQRVESRARDASDADARVVQKQASLETGPIAWSRVSAEGAVDETVNRVRETILSH